MSILPRIPRDFLFLKPPAAGEQVAGLHDDDTATLEEALKRAVGCLHDNLIVSLLALIDNLLWFVVKLSARSFPSKNSRKIDQTG